jgi:hypothetical protein
MSAIARGVTTANRLHFAIKSRRSSDGQSDSFTELTPMIPCSLRAKDPFVPLNATLAEEPFAGLTAR